MKIEITQKKFKLHFDDSEVELTLDELRDLRDKINGILGDTSNPLERQPWIIPTCPEPYHPYQPHPVNPNPWITWCGDGTGSPPPQNPPATCKCES